VASTIRHPAYFAKLQIEEWLNPPSFFGSLPLPFDDISALTCGVEVRVEETAGVNLMRQRAADLTTKLVDVLRLITNHNIYIAFTEDEFQEAPRQLFPLNGKSWGASLRFASFATTLDEAASKRLVDLWHRCYKSRNAPHIELALKRWSSTAERLSDDDKLIDYWIALESLFTPDSTQEMTFRASLRIAAYLGQTPSERHKIYDDMRHSFSTGHFC
jgi:hypothetical protein